MYNLKFDQQSGFTVMSSPLPEFKDDEGIVRRLERLGYDEVWAEADFASGMHEVTAYELNSEKKGSLSAPRFLVCVIDGTYPGCYVFVEDPANLFALRLKLLDFVYKPSIEFTLQELLNLKEKGSRGGRR
jgi:hypothetical protein